MPIFVHYSRPWLSAFLGSFVSVVCLLRLVGPSQAQQGFDLVIANGVIDPESNLDAVRNIGISGGAIHAISAEQLAGRTTVDASGLVVSPGFIDLHQHARTQIIAETERIKAMDGVTTALELEVGTDDVDRWYGAREGKALINYGVSMGHIAVRSLSWAMSAIFSRVARRPIGVRQTQRLRR